jgi:hypothetical protein
MDGDDQISYDSLYRSLRQESPIFSICSHYLNVLQAWRKHVIVSGNSCITLYYKFGASHSKQHPGLILPYRD